MKLTRVEVTNYRSLFIDGNEMFAVDLADGMNALIGPNNCGKSNVLRAIALALDPDFTFDRELDKPAGWSWAKARVTLDFRCDSRTTPERTLMKNVEAYELSAKGGDRDTHAADGLVRFTVSFAKGPAADSPDEALRREAFFVRGAGARAGDPELLRRALNQFRRCLRFVLIESGQDLQSVLAGKFRDILHNVIREHLKDQFDAARRRRAGYVESLQNELLDPLRGRVQDVVQGLFPEVNAVSLVPHVSSIDETLSNVTVTVTDAIETSLAAKGTGVRGAVLVAMLRYLADQTKRSMVFAVEEPEAFLHPSAQEELRDDLEALAMRRDISVIITTHSPFIVSRDQQAKVIALAKDAEGRTRISGQAAGTEPHASLLGGLFRDAALPDILDRSARIPATAGGILIVEGITDERFLSLAAAKLKRPDLLRDLYITAAGGAEKAVAQAVLMKQQTLKPLLVLFDDDDIGKACRDNLTKRFSFTKKEVLSYAEIVGHQPNGTECEDLFPGELIERFVQRHGETKVIKRKEARKDGGWRYDLNATGKDSIGDFVADHATAEDFAMWLKLIEVVRERLGLGK